MPKHVDDYLSAYMDGELTGKNFQYVKSHIATCRLCADKLSGLKNISSALHEIQAPTLPAKDVFAKRVFENLPEKQASFNSHRFMNVVMWVFPILLMIVWAFSYTTTKINNAVIIANDLNLIQDTTPLLDLPSKSGIDITALLSQFGLIENDAVSNASMVETLIKSNLSSFTLSASLSILYMVWMLVWWTQNNENTRKFRYSKRNLQN